MERGVPWPGIEGDPRNWEWSWLTWRLIRKWGHRSTASGNWILITNWMSLRRTSSRGDQTWLSFDFSLWDPEQRMELSCAQIPDTPCEIMNRCCFELPSLWQFVKQQLKIHATPLRDTLGLWRNCLHYHLSGSGAEVYLARFNAWNLPWSSVRRKASLGEMNNLSTCR